MTIDPNEVETHNKPHKEEVSPEELYNQLKEYEKIPEVERVKKEGRY
jgi:hypothetical protein